MSNIQSIRDKVQKVKDIPIFNFKRDDFEQKGFNGKGISDGKLHKMAIELESKLSTLYWDTIDEIAQDEHLPLTAF